MTSTSSEPRQVGAPKKYSVNIFKKICFTCGFEKTISEFYKDHRSSSGCQTKCKECMKIYYSTNKEHYQKLKNGNVEYAIKMKDYFDRNKDKVNEYKRLRYSSEDGYLKVLNLSSRRRALKLSTSDGTITARSLKDLLVKQDYKCAISGKKLSKFDLDHIIPLSKGGLHSISNVQFISPSINRSKKDKIYV